MSRDKAQGPRYSIQPHRRLSVFKWITCTIEPHQSNQKEVTTPGKHVLSPVHMKMAASSLLSFTGKRRCCRSWKLPVTAGLIFRKNWRHTAASCSTKRLRQGENRKMASSSLYLNELLIQKGKFRDHFYESNFSLERLFPKGSYHLDETGMKHTLAQK